MSRTYVLSRFLRQTPNRFLKQYFAELGLLGTIDFDVKERDIDAIHFALPENNRQQIEADFRDIDALASERGFRAMMDEVAWRVRNNPLQNGHDRDLTERLANADGEHERAVWFFLNRGDYWHAAMRFFEADTVAPSYWQKRKNLPKIDSRVDPAVINNFAQTLGGYFHVMQGRGVNCHVEPLRRNELHYFFCFGHDYSQAPQEWVDGKLDRRPRNPTHEVIFIYSKDEGKLDTYSKAGKREVPDLEAIFADIILGHKQLQSKTDDNRIYDLDVFKNRNFAFDYPPVVPAVLTIPNRCSLRHDGLDLVVRKMLADSGIEPREP